jgi:hypothetical protein
MPTDPEELEALEERILTNLSSPKKASGDQGSVEQHSLKDQIEFARYLAGKTATRSRTLGIRFSKLIPPGAD